MSAAASCLRPPNLLGAPGPHPRETDLARVIVFGADGYLGWPTAMHLARHGHEVVAADSLVRRRWDRECGTDTLIPIQSMPARARAWAQRGTGTIEWRRVDLRRSDEVNTLVATVQPDAIVHFAEQRSAPYSMISRAHAELTQSNNVIGTLNVL